MLDLEILFFLKVFFLLISDFFEKRLIKILLNKKLDKIKLEKIYVKIKVIFIYFQSIGFLEQISNGCIP